MGRHEQHQRPVRTWVCRQCGALIYVTPDPEHTCGLCKLRRARGAADVPPPKLPPEIRFSVSGSIMGPIRERDPRSRRI